jgi:hypothetical protein
MDEMNTADSTSPTDRSNTMISLLGPLQRRMKDGPDRATLYADPAFTAALTEAFDELVAQHETSLISVDVFDTALIRAPTSELRRFSEIAAFVAQRESAEDSPAFGGPDVLMARLCATQASYSVSAPLEGCREGTLSEIAAVTASCLGLDSQSAQRIVSDELDYEVSTLIFNEHLHSLLDKAAAAGTKVLYLSDMYLDAGQIRRLLRDVGGIEDAEVISSADVKVSKAAGTGYENLIRRSGVAPEEIVHIGDSLRSDYQQARRNGIRALHLPIPDCEIAEVRRDHAEMVETFHRLGVDITRWKGNP